MCVEKLEDSKTASNEEIEVQVLVQIDHEVKNKEEDKVAVKTLILSFHMSYSSPKLHQNSLLGMLFAKIMLMELECGVSKFCWNTSLQLRFIILRYYKT